jgi:hypothetical protein
MEINYRIRKFLKAKKITVQSFESSISRSNGYLSHTKSPTANVIKRIAEIYPDINLDWLLTGKGEMFKINYQNNDTSNNMLRDSHAQYEKNNEYSLYYYTTAETLLKILGDASTPRIKYSNFNNTNDPKERTLYCRHYAKNRQGETMNEKDASDSVIK